jgi:hypothetical protein
MLDEELCGRLDANHLHVASTLCRKWANLEISEYLFMACGKCQDLWRYRVVSIVCDRTCGDPERTIRPNWPDPKRWSSVTKGRSAMDYVARADYLWATLALPSLAQATGDQKQHNGEHAKFDFPLEFHRTS